MPLLVGNCFRYLLLGGFLFDGLYWLLNGTGVLFDGLRCPDGVFRFLISELVGNRSSCQVSSIQVSNKYGTKVTLRPACNAAAATSWPRPLGICSPRQSEMPVFLMCSRVEDQVAGDWLLNEVRLPEKQFKKIYFFWPMGLANLTDWAIIPNACLAQFTHQSQFLRSPSPVFTPHIFPAQNLDVTY
jgi:hypothetical protein